MNISASTGFYRVNFRL